MTTAPTILEVLPERGRPQVWVTCTNDRTYRIDLTPLCRLESHLQLRLATVAEHVRVAASGQAICWPGGAELDVASVQRAPGAMHPVRLMGTMTPARRYRPLLPYLEALQPAIYLRPAPIDAQVISQMLSLKTGELDSAPRHYHAPAELVLNRIYDVALFLQEHFSRDHLNVLLRRPWPYAQRVCPGDPLLHTMLDCLRYGRPDLIERPCQLLAVGPSAWNER